jgi:hypothetical protein
MDYYMDVDADFDVITLNENLGLNVRIRRMTLEWKIYTIPTPIP